MSAASPCSWDEVLEDLDAQLDAVERALDAGEAPALAAATWQPPLTTGPPQAHQRARADAALQRVRGVEQRLLAARDRVAGELSTVDRRRVAGKAYGDHASPSTPQQR